MWILNQSLIYVVAHTHTRTNGGIRKLCKFIVANFFQTQVFAQCLRLTYHFDISPPMNSIRTIFPWAIANWNWQSWARGISVFSLLDSPLPETRRERDRKRFAKVFMSWNNKWLRYAEFVERAEYTNHHRMKSYNFNGRSSMQIAND